ncbi:MAG: DNA polymerase III PolC-type [Bacteroidia bacterium]|nr:DNA polymerase III PolC-type [Bacteroidia bacterium]
MIKLNKALAVFDLETTGTKVATDRIVEISIVKIFPGGDKESITRRINPGIPIPAEASAVHGIYDEHVKDKPLFKDAAHELKNYIGDSDLAGYNCLNFDVPLLVEEFLRVGVDFDVKNRRIVDVQNIFHKMEQRTLSAAYKFYCQKDLENAHSAEADTLATYEVLEAQLERYPELQNDVKFLHDFSIRNRNVDFAGHIIFNEKNEEVINFGKHKGKVVTEVLRAEPSYYNWMMTADFPQYTKKVLTEIRLRSFNK